MLRIKLITQYYNTVLCALLSFIIMLCHSKYHYRNARGVSDEKRRRNSVKAGSIEIVGQHHENQLDIFILYIISQSDFSRTKS